MSKRTVRNAYVIALGVVSVVLVPLTLLPGEHMEPAGRSRSDGETATSGRSGSLTPSPVRRVGRPTRRAARKVAVRFLRAFLRYERGDMGSAVRAGLTQAASAGLRRELLARPARAWARVAPGTVRGLALYGPLFGRLKASALIARPGQSRSLLELGLRRRPVGWSVVSVAP